MSKTPITYYPHKEEVINVITHFFGLVMSVVGLILLVTFAFIEGTVWHIVSFSIYGSSMVILYLASTLFHYAKKKKLRKKLNIFDHVAIYVLIAGTYTPFCLIVLKGPIGWALFGVAWGLALVGIVLKLFFIGRYNKLSTISYVLLGWVAVVAAKPLINNLETEGLVYLLIGGVSYTIGAVFFSMQKLSYNHAIFHVLVLIGTFFHFVSVFFYVL